MNSDAREALFMPVAWDESVVLQGIREKNAATRRILFADNAGKKVKEFFVLRVR